MKKVKKLDLSQWVVTKFYHYQSVAGDELGEYDEVWHSKPIGDPYIKEVFNHFMTIADHYFHLDGHNGTLYDNKVTIQIENIDTGKVLYVSSKDGRYRLGTTYFSERGYHTDFGIIHKN